MELHSDTVTVAELSFDGLEVRVFRVCDWRTAARDNTDMLSIFRGETESYEFFSASSGARCARICENFCKMKLYWEGTDRRIRQFGKRPYEILRKITALVFLISLLTPFFTSVLYLSPFLPTSAPCPIASLSIPHTHYRRDNGLPFDI